jgi:hypothetical protein
MPQVRVRPASQTRAKRRAERRTELLQPDATVTLSDERSTAGIDDIFTALNNELVGLVPVKKKVEEIASLLLVDRVRQKFWPVRAPAEPAHVLHRRAGNREDHCRTADG